MFIYIFPTLISIIADLEKYTRESKIFYWFSALRSWKETDWIIYCYNLTQDVLMCADGYREPFSRILILFSINLSILTFGKSLMVPLTRQSSSRFIAFFLPGACVYWAHLFVRSPNWLKMLSALVGSVIFLYITDLNPGWILPYHSIFDDYRMSYNEFIWRIYL